MTGPSRVSSRSTHAEIDGRERRARRAAQPDVLRLPLRAHADGGRRRHPGVQTEQSVLLPRVLDRESDRRARASSSQYRATRSRSCVRRTSVGIELHSTYATSRMPGRAADHRPVEESGAVVAVDEEVAEVRVAVDERALALAVQRQDVARALRGRTRRAVGSRRAAGRRGCRRHLHERRAAVAADRSPCGASHARSPSGFEAIGLPSTARAARASCSTMSRCGPRCRRRSASGSDSPPTPRSSSTIT